MSRFPQSFTSTVSHWQATNRGRSSLYDWGRHDALPTHRIDYAIVGGGLTGASMAYQLVKQRPNCSVVVLEAKDVASGATGRNGGHIAPYAPTSFSAYTRAIEDGGPGLSDEQALEVIYHEMDNFKYAQELIKQEGWEVDLWIGERLEVLMTGEHLNESKQALERFAQAKARSAKYKDYPSHFQLVDDPKEAEELSRVHGARGAVKCPSGSVHPHKLSTALLRSAMESGRCDLFSWCPVSSYHRDKDGWTVETRERGTVQCREVIFCTNAHTKWLFENTDIDHHLQPYRGSCAQVTPTPAFSGLKSLNFTTAVADGCYYMSLPTGQMVVGVGNGALLSREILRREDTYGVVDDSKVHQGTGKFLAGFCASNLVGWGDEAMGEGSMRQWSGIMCASRDGLPLVGAVPGKDNAWITVGFHGHGMSRIFAVAKSLASNISTGSWDGDLPRSFEITQERLKRGKLNQARWKDNLGQHGGEKSDETLFVD